MILPREVINTTAEGYATIQRATCEVSNSRWNRGERGKEDQQRRGGGRREANAKGGTGAGAPILLLTADLAAAALSAGRLAASGRCLLGGRSGRGALDRLAGNLATLALVDQRLKKKNNNTTRQNAHKSTTIHLLLHHLTFSSFPLRDLILMCDLVDVLKK